MAHIQAMLIVSKTYHSITWYRFGSIIYGITIGKCNGTVKRIEMTNIFSFMLQLQLARLSQIVLGILIKNGKPPLDIEDSGSQSLSNLHHNTIIFAVIMAITINLKCSLNSFQNIILSAYGAAAASYFALPRLEPLS